MKRHTTHILLGTLLAIVLSGCGEMTDNLDNRDLETQETAIVVTPQFELVGLNQFTPQMHLKKIKLGIGEVRMEPLDIEGEVIYISKEPEILNFHIDQGIFAIDSRPITLPHKGKYLVSLRLEPIDEELIPNPKDPTGEKTNSSFYISGALSARYFVAPPLDNNKPTPLPWRTQKFGDEELQFIWIPFSYESQRIAYFELGVIEILGDSSQMIIGMDFSNWVSEAVTPILSEVIYQETPEDENSEANSIDLTDELDLVGQGMERALGNSSVTIY